MRINYLKIVLAIAVLLWQTGCAAWPEYQTGTYALVTTITIQDDWCYLDDINVNGLITYKRNKSISNICISKKSENIRGTIKHELEHATLRMLGEDTQTYFR